VSMLMQSPMAEGLFTRAIIQSGPGLFPSNTLGLGTPMEAAEQTGLEFAKAKGAASLAELRAMPPEALLDVPQGVRFGPIQDNWFLSEKSRTEKQVPVMNGFTADDMGAGGSFGPPPEATIQAYEKEVRERYGEGAETFLALYSAHADQVVPAMRKTSGRDRARVSLYLWASEQARKSSRVYTYYFDRAIPWPEHPQFGAFHSGALPYVFNNLHLFDRPWEAIDYTLADQVSTYWTNFAKTGDPNISDSSSWPLFNMGEAKTMYLGARTEALPIVDPDKLTFWRKVLSEE